MDIRTEKLMMATHVLPRKHLTHHKGHSQKIHVS